MMPSEPDKKIEDLLRTYARKRREDAGEPLEMHPATRRQLQAEAAKLRPREEPPERTFWSWLSLRWPRVAFAGGIVALLAIAVWNWTPEGGRSSSPSLLAKSDQETEGLSRLSADESNGKVAPKTLDSLAEQDKDVAKRSLPEALTAAPRPLDEYRVETKLSDGVAQADTKLKEEPAALGVGLRSAPASGLKDGETAAAAGRVENQVMLRKLQKAPTAPQVATREATDQLESTVLITNAAGLSLARAPGTEARGKQLGFADSTAGGAVGGTYYRAPVVSQSSPATDAVPLFVQPGGPGQAAEPRPIAPNGRTIPAAPTALAFDSRNLQFKGGRANSATERLDSPAGASLEDLSAGRARGAVTSVSGVLLEKETTQTPSSPRQLFRFRRMADSEKPVAAKAAFESTPAGVLSTFEFEQDGERVRLTDSDGSVYTGSFVTEGENEQVRFGEMAEKRNRPAPAGAEPRDQSLKVEAKNGAYAAGGSGPSTTNRIFRASGTNRTYGQLVTIEASLSAGSDSLAADKSRGLKPATTAQAPAPPPPALPSYRFTAPQPAAMAIVPAEASESRRLVGRVRIGGTNEARLIAVPVAR